MLAFGLLMLAIAVEVAASALLPRAAGFTHLGWTAAVLAGYGTAIWLLTLVVRRMDVSVAYAIWSGLGTAAIAVIGYFWLGESFNLAKAAGIAFIVAGVILINIVPGVHPASH